MEEEQKIKEEIENKEEEQEKIYAQIRKEDNRVNLIGGTKDGLFLFNLPLAYTIDITEHKDNKKIQIGMKYIRETDNFIETEEEILPEEKSFSIEDMEKSVYLDMEYLIALKELEI